MIASGLRRRAVLGGVLRSAVVVMVSTAVVSVAAPSADAGLERPAVTLLSQSSFVSGTEGSSFQMSLQLSPALLDATTADSRLVLTAHRPTTSRAEVRSAVEGDLPQIIDAVAYPLSDLLAASSSGANPGRIDLLVRTEIGLRQPDFLQMSAAGTYPLTIDVEISSEFETRLVSFIERLDSNSFAPSSASTLGLAIVGTLTAPISVAADSRTVISPSTQQLIREWVEFFERRPDLPLSISLRPEMVEGFERSTPEDQDLLIRFQRAAAFEAMSTTFVQMDPTDVHRHQLSDVFTRQLRLGEAAIAAKFPALVTPRHSWMQTDPLSAGGARTLADLGFRTVVLPANAANASLDEDGGDPTRTVELEFAADETLIGVTTDVELAEMIQRGSIRPEGGEHLVAHQLLAELKMALFELPADERRSLVLTTPTGELPSPSMVEAIVDVLARDSRFPLLRLDDALELMNDVEEPVRLELADLLDQPPTFPESQSLGLVIAGLDVTVDAFASALPAGDDRVRDWRRLIDVVPDSRLSSEERRAYVESIRAGTDDIAAAVVPPTSTTFTLGGRNSPIRFTIRNDGPTDIDVLVRLRSSKLRLPEGDKVVTLLAGASTAVEFAVSARSNGRFPVTLQILTPEGDVLLGTPATLTARVNALAGLGQLVTGIALLFLASWWANHFRREYRRRQSEASLSSQRHPSGDRLV